VRRTAKLLAAALMALTAAAAPAAAAQGPGEDQDKQKEQEAVLSESINVTAKRYQAEELDTGAFTTVLTEEDIAKQGGLDAFDLLQRNGGVSFSASLPGGITQGGMNGEIGVRGINGGEQIMLNGVSIIEPTAEAYDLDQIPAAFLERVEMVKGASSTLYGSRAMTGVINMRTKRPGSPATGGQLLGGSNGYADGNAWYRDELVFLGASYVRFDDLSRVKANYSKTSPYNTNLFGPQKYAALASVQPLEPLTLNYMFNYTDAGYEAAYYKKPASSYKVDEVVYHHYLSAVYERDVWQATAFFNYNYMKLDYDYYGDAKKPGKETNKKSFTTGVDAQGSADVLGSKLLYGGTYLFEQQDETRQDVMGSSKAGYYIRESILDHTRHQPSVFVQIEKTFWDKLILTPGVRGQGVINTEEGQDNYFEPVPQVQAVFKANQFNSIFANVGRAFRAPTFNQLFATTNTFVGNKDLDPEYGWSYELGWKFDCGPFNGVISGFMMDYTDKIRYVYNTADELYYAKNMDKYRSTGVEWRFAWQATDTVELVLAGYGADPWEEQDGEREQAGPKWQVAPGVYYDNGVLSLGLNAEVLLARERGLDDYVNVHLTGSYALTKWLKLQVRADNLLDRDQAVYGNMTPGYSGQYEVLDPGLWLYGGVVIDMNLL